MIFSESSHVPNFKVWESLDAFPLTEEHCRELEVLPQDKYFEIPTSNAQFGSVNMLFDTMRPEGDKSILKKIAFKYSKDRKSGETFLFILSMTDKGSRRCKEHPFIIQFVMSLSHVKNGPKSIFEGVFQVKPKKGSIKDEACERKRIIDDLISEHMTKAVSQSFSRTFPVDSNSQSRESTEAEKFDRGINVNSYVLIRVKELKNVILAHVQAVTSSEVILNLLKPKKTRPEVSEVDPQNDQLEEI